METLLISPASRGEIVMGKFLTVVLASMMTALLNLASMGLTAMQLAGQVGGMARRRPARGRGGHGGPVARLGGLDGPAAHPALGLLQRRLRGPGGAGPEHEGGPVLHDARST